AEKSRSVWCSRASSSTKLPGSSCSVVQSTRSARRVSHTRTAARVSPARRNGHTEHPAHVVRWASTRGQGGSAMSSTEPWAKLDVAELVEHLNEGFQVIDRSFRYLYLNR